MTQKTQDIASLRRKTLSTLRRKIAPHFHPSGYNKRLEPEKGLLGAKRPLMVWFPKNDKPIQIGGYVADQIMGITEDGVVEDAYGHWMETTYWRALPLEDLLRLLKWADRTFVAV